MPPEDSDAFARQYFDLAGVMLLALDPAACVRDINHKGAEILGAPREEIIGRDWIASFLPPEHQASARERFRQIVSGERAMPQRGEGPVITVDGRRRVIAWQGSLLRDPEGRVIATLSSGEDVTEARQSEWALKKVEEHLRLAEEAGGVGVWWADALTGRLHASRQLLRLWGFEPGAQLTTEQQLAMLHPDDRERVTIAYQRAIDGMVPVYDVSYRIIRPDGSMRWLAARAEAVRDSAGAITGMRGVTFDITELRAAQASALESERRFGEIADIAPALMWIAGPDKKVTWTNRGWLELTGCSLSQQTGWGWAESVHPDDRERVVSSYKAAFDARAPYRMEYRLRRHDGAWRWISETGAPHIAADGSFLGFVGAGVDVTDEKRALALARESERRFGQIADAAPMLVWVSGLDKVRRWFNRRWLEFTGNTLAEEVKDRAHTVHPDDRARAVAAYEAAFDRRESFRQEYRLRRHDGLWRWIEETGTPHYDTDGRFLGYVGAGADVTDQKAAIDALHVSEARFRAFAESSHDVFWISDAQVEHITWTNAAFEKLTGLPREALYADVDLLRMAIHPDDLAMVDASRAALRHGESCELEYRIRRADGEERVLNDTAFPIFDDDGRLCWAGGMARDVTDRRRAEARLRSSEARFRAFAENAEEVVWLLDTHAVQLDYLGPAYERVVGDARENFLKDVRRWRDIVVPEDLPLLTQAAMTALRGERCQVEVRIVRPSDGVERVVQTAMFQLSDVDGGFRWLGGLTRDVTDQVLAREELERRVAERTRELETTLQERRAAEEALAQAQRLETVGRLTGGVAHDFNNLLTVVIGGLDMILRHAENPDTVRRLGEAALAAGRRGERLTKQLLAFSRRQELKLETRDLHALITGFEPLIRGAVGEATPLNIDIAPDLGVSRLDPVQFEAALLNLVVNANDAVDATGGGISVHARRVRLAADEVPGTPPGDYACVSVVDTGPGMSPEVAAHALEPFFTTKEVGKGSGLGLAQVYGFARQSGGGVRIRTAPGEGAAISLFLPLTDSAALTPEPIPAPAELRELERGAEVLLVEDDAGVRSVVEKLLQELGCQVLTADDGPSALEVLKDAPKVKLLLSDVVMPGGMSGVDLARAAQALRPDLKVLLSTGYAQDRLADAEPGWPVLSKPYQAEELAQAARRALM